MSYESDVKLLPALEAQLEQLEPQLGATRDDLLQRRPASGRNDNFPSQKLF